MPYVPHTLSTIAAEIAKIDGASPGEILTRLRYRPLKVLLREMPRTGGDKSPSKYPDEELLRARFLLCANDADVRVEDLPVLSEALGRAAQGKLGQPINTTALNAALAGIRAGEEWRCLIVCSRDRDGRRHIRAHIDARDDIQSDAQIQALDESFGDRLRFTHTITLNLNFIFGPLLAAEV